MGGICSSFFFFCKNTRQLDKWSTNIGNWMRFSFLLLAAVAAADSNIFQHNTQLASNYIPNWQPHILTFFKTKYTIENGNSVWKVVLIRGSVSFYQFFPIFAFNNMENSSIHFPFRVNLFLITETTLESIKYETTIACRLQHTNQSCFVNKLSNNSSISNLATIDFILSYIIQIPVHIFECRDQFNGALKIEKYCWYELLYCALETKCKGVRERESVRNTKNPQRDYQTNRDLVVYGLINNNENFCHRQLIYYHRLQKFTESDERWNFGSDLTHIIYHTKHIFCPHEPWLTAGFSIEKLKFSEATKKQKGENKIFMRNVYRITSMCIVLIRVQWPQWIHTAKFLTLTSVSVCPVDVLVDCKFYPTVTFCAGTLTCVFPLLFLVCMRFSFHIFK